MGNPEVLHQIKLIKDKIELLEDLVYSHGNRHMFNGGDPLFDLNADMVTSGIFDLARIPTPLKSKCLSEVFTAGTAITASQLVAITGNNTVSPADATLRSQTVGVALNNVTLGEPVEVIIYGKATVVADGVVSAGDPLAAATTAGRVVSLLSHSHTNPVTSSVDLAHDHLFTPVGSISSVSAGTPAGSISSDSAGTPSGTIAAPSGTTTVADSIHKHEVAHIVASVAWSDPVARDDYDFYYSNGNVSTHVYTGSSAIGVVGDLYTLTPTTTVSVASSTHTHTFTGSALPTHTHTFTGSALPTHSHTFTGSAGLTDSALSTHSHTQGDTGAVNNAQIVGKALTAAAGAGSSLDILVCLAG